MRYESIKRIFIISFSKYFIVKKKIDIDNKYILDFKIYL